ncbi:MAG TPA: hypothetical protein VKB12_05420 [Pyrinomonadaceae bacterium]|nr:hypothetical protein [Pyrinomonadaceae bacterium]
MSKKLLCLLLTLVTLLAASPVRARAAEELTDEDRREAGALAVTFMRRLREKDDFAPLVSEFFPEDFERRIKQFLRDNPPKEGEEAHDFPCDRALLLRAESGGLRRAYVALMNFWNQQELLHNAARDYVKVEYAAAGRDASEEYREAWTRRQELAEKAVPEEAFRIAEGDPLIEALFLLLVRAGGGDEDVSEEKAEEDKAEEETAKLRAGYIRDAERLHSFLDNLERCVALLREGVKRLRADAKDFAASHGITEVVAAADADGDEFNVYHLSYETVEAPAFGLPAGALVICANIFGYDISMTRAEGKLQILGVHPAFD